MERRVLGASELRVSPLALGSWRTLERLPRERALALMMHARERGVNFLDDARYDDESGTAPLSTGWSEVLFGELFRATGWVRDDTVVANKLWWEHWPAQSAEQELAGSLERLRFDHVDLIYSVTLPDGLTIEAAVEEIAGLLASGSARAWGVANWTAEQLDAARIAADARGIAPPCAIQLPYSVVRRDWVEDPAMAAAITAAGAGLIPSAVLEGGALSGKYAGAAAGRLADQLEDPAVVAAVRAGERLAALAAELGTAPATLATAFALAAPNTASVLVGATSPEQLDESLAAVALLARLTGDELARVRSLA